jgi:hypothetical protein
MVGNIANHNKTNYSSGKALTSKHEKSTTEADGHLNRILTNF